MANEFVARNGLIAQSNSAITGSLTQGAAGNIASGINSHAEGTTTVASGPYAHAEGFTTTATGDYSHAEGQYTTALGVGSHAEGQYAYALGDYSHAEGISTQALGYMSHAEGRSTVASGLGSHAEGGYTYALGDYSHTEGQYNTALGVGSHAEGYYTYATGDYSHAEGQYTSASGNFSHAEGLYNTALADYQHVQGQYNRTSSISSAFIVGNGTSTGSRSNLIFAAGNAVEVSGSLRVSGSITGSLFGTSSWAISSSNSLSASYALTSISSSYSDNSISASYALTSSYVNLVAGTNITINQVGSEFQISGSAFPYTGDAQITGSLLVSGSATFTGPVTASDYQTSWSDFSSTSTLVGWSSTTRKVVRYMRIGKLGIIEYDIFGTSNSATVATFTIPFTASGLQVTQSNNNQCFNTATVPSGQTAVASGSSLAVVNYYSTAIAFGTAWSGNKGVRGVLTLEIV